MEASNLLDSVFRVMIVKILKIMKKDRNDKKNQSEIKT